MEMQKKHMIPKNSREYEVIPGNGREQDSSGTVFPGTNPKISKFG